MPKGRKVDRVTRLADNLWEWTRQGKLKWLVHPETGIAAKGKWIYFQEIPAGSGSGTGCHTSEELIFVLGGRGYDVHDEERWEWEQGDLICIPQAHQHCGDRSTLARIVLVWPQQLAHEFIGGIEHISAASGWKR